MSSCGLLAHLLLQFVCLQEVHSACTNTISAGLFFRCQLTLQDFSFTAAADGGSNITSYRVHQVGYAGRPGWIKTTATVSGERLFLFGTPGGQDIGQVQLQIILQRSDFQTSTKGIKLTVQPLRGQLSQSSEFYITNLNMEELLIDVHYNRLRETLREVYPVLGGVEPLVLCLIDPRDRNIEVPEPPEKLGVLVRVSPGLNVAMTLPTATQQQTNLLQGNCENIEDLPSPPLNFNQFTLRGFLIDWCQYSLSQHLEPTRATASEAPPISGVVTPTIGARSLVLTVIVIVVFVVIFVTMCALGAVFFGQRRNSLLVPKGQRSRRAYILHDTQSSVYEVSKAQVVLRNLSSTPTAQQGGVALEVCRPQSTCLDYQDTPNISDGFAPPPPAYHYDERLTDINRSYTP